MLIKNPKSKINKSQQQRSKKLLKDLKDISPDISFCDGNSYQVGDTEFIFSIPLPHGPEGSKLGYVVALTIRHKNETVMHASDVQGPIHDKTKDYILKQDPDTLILSGPPLYLLGFAFSHEDIEKSRTNLTEICREIPQVVVDHHLLRDFRGFDFIKSVQENTKTQIKVASELIGKKPNLLEARRKEFYLE